MSLEDDLRKLHAQWATDPLLNLPAEFFPIDAGTYYPGVSITTMARA